MTTMNINNMTRTWNSGGTTYEAIKMNVTDAASASDSLLLSLLIGGAYKFMVAKTGDVTMRSSDAGAGAGPTFTLHRDSASPADDDILGEVVFAGEDDGGAQTNYARIYAQAKDVTDSTEDGALFLQAMIAGSLVDLAQIDASGISLNDPSDPTKQGLFVLSGITTATRRSYTLPDYNGTLATLAGTETLTNKTLSTAVATGTFSIPDGDLSTPGIRFSADTDVGMYRIGNNQWGLCAGGATSLFFNGTSLASGPVQNNTTASAANMVISTNVFFRSTSAAKYKRDFRPIDADKLAAFKKLVGGHYYSLCAGDDPDKMHTGVIADEAHKLGLNDLVIYEEGEIEGFAYERCAAYFLAWNSETEARLAKLEAAS